MENKKRVSMNYKEIAHKERQTARDNFLAYEQGKAKLHILLFIQICIDS